ncbi:hypothetical protein O6H91_16G066400 [Diphasiastrum complanatum]|uniref:Uncharacterized protein n=1 Tax=Diphasiastrum complanatum TaxID=34168 RepID=A0ACC2BD15_DIPCM|nr:hypothetical protein O6H91_16G066400 [Diphasiastrum complanatum]
MPGFKPQSFKLRVLLPHLKSLKTFRNMIHLFQILLPSTLTGFSVVLCFGSCRFGARCKFIHQALQWNQRNNRLGSGAQKQGADNLFVIFL